MRVFLDTNVLVSAFATRGLSADVFEAVLVEHDLVTGATVLEELSRALRTKLRYSPARSGDVVGFIESQAVLVVRNAKLAACAAEEDDCRVLGEALSGEAEVFVTGDAALLALDRLGSLRIVSPRQFWQLLQSR